MKCLFSFLLFTLSCLGSFFSSWTLRFSFFSLLLSSYPFGISFFGFLFSLSNFSSFFCYLIFGICFYFRYFFLSLFLCCINLIWSLFLLLIVILMLKTKISGNFWVLTSMKCQIGQNSKKLSEWRYILTSSGQYDVIMTSFKTFCHVTTSCEISRL